LFVGLFRWRCSGSVAVVLWWIQAFMLEDNGGIK
jgi:hypothetical protein